MKRLSRKLFSLIFLLSLLLTTSLFACLHTEAGSIDTNTWLQVEGLDLKNADGEKVILRGISLPDIAIDEHRKKKDWPSKSAVELIDLLSDNEQGWYANVIRLTVVPDRRNGYNKNPQEYYEKYIQPAADQCVASKVYCIIDWHYVDDPRQVESETRAFWQDIAPKFKDYPNIFFEIFNENSTDMSWNEWHEIAQSWVDLIRSVAPKNLILVGAPHYAQHLYDAPKNPIIGENIIYVAHIYPGLDPELWDDWIFSVAKQIPIFVTEWGFRKDAPEPCDGTISSFGIPFKRKLEQYRLSWVCWVADYSWYPEMFDRNWNLLVGENYMGGFVKDYLVQKQR